MQKPTLKDFGLTESDYQSYNASPEIYEAFLLVLGFILGGIGAFFGSKPVTSLTSLLNLLFLIYACGMIGGFFLRALAYVFRDFILRHHKLHSSVSQYEATFLAYKRTQDNFWKNLSGMEFEKQLGKLFSLQGYKVQFTPASGDKGIDLILLDEYSTKVIVQCKAHKKPVAPNVVRDLYGTLISSKAASAILASASGFTKGVYEFAKDKKRIELLSLKEIIEMSEEVGHAQTVGSIKESS